MDVLRHVQALNNFVNDDVKATLTDQWVKREQRKFGMKG